MRHSKPIGLLLVDDEPDVLLALEWTLEQLPLRILTATSGEEALASIARVVPDIVLSDFQMRGMDGLTLLERVHFACPQVMCLLHTGAMVPPRFGCDFPVLAKPCSAETVRALMVGLIADIEARRLSPQRCLTVRARC